MRRVRVMVMRGGLWLGLEFGAQLRGVGGLMQTGAGMGGRGRGRVMVRVRHRAADVVVKVHPSRP